MTTPFFVHLEGGPGDFPREWRLQQRRTDCDRVKVEHRGGYEHFERTDLTAEVEGRDGVVFRWVMRTWMAE